MRVKRFIGNNVHEAMRQVKQEMGVDAVILHTRAVKPSGLFGFLKKEQVEITAAIENSTINPPAMEKPLSTNYAGIKEVTSQIHQMQKMMAEVKTEIEFSQTVSVYPKNLQKIYQRLLAKQIDPKLAKYLIEKIPENCSFAEIKNIEICESYLVSLIEEILKDISPIVVKQKKLKVVALIGPTGVGKTTTVAKLAAHFSILERFQVALVTIDTYRIAAVEQLKIYAEIIGIPLEVVFTPQDLHNSLLKFRRMDLILIDTAGRSHKNQIHMAELKEFVANQSIDKIENVLVLSAAGNNEDLLDIANKYHEEVGYDKLIFTKLDETSSLGTLLNIRSKVKKPLSYLTTGQNVPDDIELANPHRLANLMVRGKSI